MKSSFFQKFGKRGQSNAEGGSSNATTKGPSSSAKAGSSSAEPELTFGIELEYILVLESERLHNIGSFADRPQDKGWKIVEQALAEPHTWKCPVENCYEELRFELQLNPVGGSEAYDAWTVKGELLNATPSEKEKLGSGKQGEIFHPVGVEIVSRVLGTKNNARIRCSNGHMYEMTAEEEIRITLERLRSKFCTFEEGKTPTAYLYVNDDCSVHVHVGRQHAGFDLRTVKNVLSASIVAERLIDQLHATSRLNGSDYNVLPLTASALSVNRSMAPQVSNDPFSIALSYCAARRRQLHMDLVLPDMWERQSNHYPQSMFKSVSNLRAMCRAKDMDAWVKVIEHAPSIHDLVALLAPKPRSKVVNILNLRMHGIPKRTIEFRQHCGTLDSNAIEAWVDVVMRIVWMCCEPEGKALEQFLDPNGPIRHPEADALHLCDFLGVQTKTREHYDSRLSGNYARNLLHGQKRGAYNEKKRALKNGLPSPLADLIIYNVDHQRARLTMTNVMNVIQTKYLIGSYGQFPKPWVEAKFGNSATPEEKHRITMGYEATGQVHGQYDSPTFPALQSRTSSSCSERSFYSDDSGRIAEARKKPGLRIATISNS